MAKNKIYIGFVLDETGSMLSVKGQTISGFNEYIETLANSDEAKEIRFTLVKFNSDKREVVCDNAKLKDVPLLTDENYQPDWCTPLYDAVGTMIRTMEGKVKENCKTLVVIQTDGLENDSKEFRRETIFDLITAKKADGWTFVFLGADQDAWAAGGAMGLDKGNVMSYASASTGDTFSKAARRTVTYTASDELQTDRFFGDAEQEE